MGCVQFSVEVVAVNPGGANTFRSVRTLSPRSTGCRTVFSRRERAPGGLGPFPDTPVEPPVLACGMKPSVYSPPASGLATADRYVILADRSHLKVYQESALPTQQTPTMTLINAVDFPSGRADYTDRESDKASQFPRSKVAPGGGSNDERLPMQRERDERIAEEIAMRIENFLAKHPETSWVYAAGPDMHRPILQRIHSRFLKRLQGSVQKDLANLPPAELLEHFPRGVQATGL